MKQNNQYQVSKAIEFIESLELPRPPRARRSAQETANVVFNETKKQSVVVGENVVSFIDGVKPAHKEVIANSSLLAQLAANRKVPDKEQIEAWYDVYFDTLTALGWIVQESGFSEHHEAGNDIETNQAILSVASVVFGPASTALAVVTTTLNAMKSMSAGPWMTLFKQESQAAKAARFQFTVVESAPDGDPLISLMAFELEAKTNLVQVLFFKFKKTDVTLKHSSGKVTINDSILSSISELVAQKTTPYRILYIQNLLD